MPSVVVTWVRPEMPPTTETDFALIVALPLSVSADELLELSYMLQPLSTTFGVPLALMSTLAVLSSERTQPGPPMPLTATARAPIVSVELVTTAENRRFWVCDTMTSMASRVRTFGPDVGVLFTLPPAFPPRPSPQPPLP